jgi:hypothetical protein
LYRLKGEFLLAQVGIRQHWPAAEGCFHQALDVSRRQYAKALELRAALSLSRLWQQQDKRTGVLENDAPTNPRHPVSSLRVTVQRTGATVMPWPSGEISTPESIGKSNGLFH